MTFRQALLRSLALPAIIVAFLLAAALQCSDGPTDRVDFRSTDRERVTQEQDPICAEDEDFDFEAGVCVHHEQLALEEDEAGWDCNLNGNGRCGSVAEQQ